MRTARIYGDTPVCTYHVISRVIEQKFIFGSEERQFFLSLIRAQEAFSGVRVLTWVLMSNHFHMLCVVDVEAGEALKANMSDEDILERLQHIYGQTQLREIEADLKQLRERGSKEGYESFRGRFLKRMYDLSSFVGEIKQRFSSYYNRNANRKGPLWEDRFKSLLVEGKGGSDLVLVIGAYIDLNPVRAGTVVEPADYRYCGYAAAVSGDLIARERIAELLGIQGESWEEIARCYRSILMETGVEVVDDHGNVLKKGISIEAVEQERLRDYAMRKRTLLLCKIRYFSEGLVLGSREFVEAQFKKNRAKMGVKRGEGACVPKNETLVRFGLRVLLDIRGEIRG